MNNQIPEDRQITGNDESAVADQEPEEKAAACALTALGSSVPITSHDDEDDDEDLGIEIPQRFTKSGRKRAVPFPLKLMKVLSTKKFSDIITWMPSGKSFSIVNSKAFVAEILPDHFKSAKYSSFTRKLHRWGFMRHYRGDEAGAFYHDDFQKDRMDLVEQMTCHKGEPPKAPVAKKSMPKPAPSVEEQVATPVPLPQPAVHRIVNQPTPVQQLQPLRQPESIVAQLQKQQQPLKVPVPEFSAADQLNAAIEAEVTRRLKQRIEAAAISRQALASLQHRLNPITPARQQWGMAAGSLQAQLLQMQQQKQQMGYDPSCLAYGGIPLPSRGLGELPRTNIEGAKTA